MPESRIDVYVTRQYFFYLDGEIRDIYEFWGKTPKWLRKSLRKATVNNITERGLSLIVRSGFLTNRGNYGR